MGSANRAFPRGSANRSTFHSGQTRERRPLNGPGGAPLQTQDTSSVNQTRSSFFSKLSSKFSKRYVTEEHADADLPSHAHVVDRVVLPESENEKNDAGGDGKESRKDLRKGMNSV